jgi:hypothetical protein
VVKLIKVSLLCLLGAVGLALPVFATEEQAGATHCASYSITVNQYFNGEEVGVTELGNLQDTAKSNACQICAPSEPGGIPSCFMLILPPQAWTGTPWPQIKENLHGRGLPPLRETMLHGLRIYYYFPSANDVKFTISARDAGAAAESWVESVTIAQ